MKKILLFAALLPGVCYTLAQPTTGSDTQVQINQYYQLALQYKDGNGVAMDYAKAFDYFEKAAGLGDAQSVYSLGYMHYKGLGCEQDYGKAASLFAQGAQSGRDNSMYFYGLCWRNGYGVTKNEDSAQYWLHKAAATGYQQAIKELAMVAGENSNDSAAALVQQINNAAIPGKKKLNEYNKIQQKLPSPEIITGNYTGWLIQYDWSGMHAVSSKQLQLNITAEDKDLTGEWIEDVKDTVAMKATLASDSVLFTNTLQSG
jgi:TPR repeat protein